MGNTQTVNRNIVRHKCTNTQTCTYTQRKANYLTRDWFLGGILTNLATWTVQTFSRGLWRILPRMEGRKKSTEGSNILWERLQVGIKQQQAQKPLTTTKRQYLYDNNLTLQSGQFLCLLVYCKSIFMADISV